MNQSNNLCRRLSRQRKGATIIFAVIMMGVLVGMLAFAIDIGYLATSRAEAQRTTDAAALAGAWQLLDGLADSQTEEILSSKVRDSAMTMVALNKVCNQSPNVTFGGNAGDIQVGYLSSLGASAPLSNNPNYPYRGVRVQLRKSEEINGQIPLFFARIFGQKGKDLTVESTAVMATQVKGFATPTVGGGNIELLPFALDERTWNNMQLNAVDNYRFDPESGRVIPGSDGVPEVNLYPQGTGSPGNRGTVDIGGQNNSTNDIARQILHGISAEDLAALGKPLVLDSSGTMTLNGDTGISAGVKDELASIVGQKRIIPIFSSVSGNGNNASYNIVAWVGIRILDVRLTGAMKSKYVYVQPAGVIARNIIPGDASRTWSEMLFSPAVLVR
jgi:hypothetical protein